MTGDGVLHNPAAKWQRKTPRGVPKRKTPREWQGRDQPHSAVPPPTCKVPLGSTWPGLHRTLIPQPLIVPSHCRSCCLKRKGHSSAISQIFRTVGPAASLQTWRHCAVSFSLVEMSWLRSFGKSRRDGMGGEKSRTFKPASYSA